MGRLAAMSGINNVLRAGLPGPRDHADGAIICVVIGVRVDGDIGPRIHRCYPVIPGIARLAGYERRGLDEDLYLKALSHVEMPRGGRAVLCNGTHPIEVIGESNAE